MEPVGAEKSGRFQPGVQGVCSTTELLVNNHIRHPM
jgi:hypothetical protein